MRARDSLRAASTGDAESTAGDDCCGTLAVEAPVSTADPVSRNGSAVEMLPKPGQIRRTHAAGEALLEQLLIARPHAIPFPSLPSRPGSDPPRRRATLPRARSASALPSAPP